MKSLRNIPWNMLDYNIPGGNQYRAIYLLNSEEIIKLWRFFYHQGRPHGLEMSVATRTDKQRYGFEGLVPIGLTTVPNDLGNSNLQFSIDKWHYFVVLSDLLYIDRIITKDIYLHIADPKNYAQIAHVHGMYMPDIPVPIYNDPVPSNNCALIA